ncbi:MAG TPA: 2'-5' RNA ligase family protein [Candidatus Saccharimonadales bacterium]|jgi:2'-5' RNA ligase
MAETGDYIVVHLVDTRKVGDRFERKRLSWPLHITLVPWFVASDMQAVSGLLEQVAARHEPFEVRVGQIDHFGADNEIPVNVIAGPQPLRRVHSDVLQVLQDTHATLRSVRWTGDNYIPHITRHEATDHYKNDGDMVRVADFHVVKLTDDNWCEVDAVYRLKGDV